jgi:hypothetical protein
MMQKSRNLTAFLIAWNTNAKVHQHQGLSNKLALPGTFEKQLSRSTILNHLTVNRIRSQSGRVFDLKLKSSRRQRPMGRSNDI